jgi:succinate dehydrogenase hydrophobic anchor subunit
MNQLPIAVRATAGALAVFMTFAMLNSMISIAEPEQSQWMAQQASPVISASSEVVIVAQGPIGAADR